jgi:hypothetical protein
MNFMNFMKNIRPSLTFLRRLLTVSLSALKGVIAILVYIAYLENNKTIIYI